MRDDGNMGEEGGKNVPISTSLCPPWDLNPLSEVFPFTFYSPTFEDFHGQGIS